VPLPTSGHGLVMHGRRIVWDHGGHTHIIVYLVEASSTVISSRMIQVSCLIGTWLLRTDCSQSGLLLEAFRIRRVGKRSPTFVYRFFLF
jgi:hypothetical protein